MLTKLYVRIQSAFVRGDEGATAVEYGIMVAAIAAVIVAVVFTLGGKVLAAFNSVNNRMP